MQAYNDENKKLVLTQLPIIQRAFVQSTSDLNRDLYIRPPPKLVSLLDASSGCIVKVMKPLYGVAEVGNHCFATYHPHYKDKLVGNLSTAFLFARDGEACDTKPGLVTKKGEPPRTSLHVPSDALQLLSFMLSLTLSKMRPTMFEYLAMFKCAPMSEWQSENLPEASFDPSLAAQTAAQTVEFSPDDIALLNKRLRRQTTNKSRQLRHVKLDPRDTHMSLCKQVTRAVLAAKLYAMAHGLDIEKRHWRRYQIVRTKSHQHKHYGMGGIGKHEMGKYERGKDGTSEHWHLATFRKSCQCHDVRSGNVMLDLYDNGTSEVAHVCDDQHLCWSPM